VPVTVPSPAGVSSYGTTAGQDELLGATVALQPVPPPYSILSTYAVADEITVHQSLAPNPDAGDPDDDDVDSLDLVLTPSACPQWYFSPDHEGHLGLDPGGIYEVTGTGPPVQVIDEAVNLGIPEDADIDAFEFTILDLPGQPGQPMLALLYSVDEDDLLTTGDESGGMDPTAIYVSWMTGFSLPFCGSLGDDVDALTIWTESLEPGACCRGTAAAPGCGRTSQTVCEVQYQGEWKGPGTDCSDGDGNGVADICEEFGACCFGPDGLACLEATLTECDQGLMGQWHGPGTDCSDFDGNGIADACDSPPEACCLPNGFCEDETPAACAAAGGVPQGPTTECATTTCPGLCWADLDDDGDTDLADYSIFAQAITGPGTATGNPAADQDGDSDCDLMDFAAWTIGYPCP
jgi:hypothetical protein